MKFSSWIFTISWEYEYILPSICYQSRCTREPLSHARLPPTHHGKQKSDTWLRAMGVSLLRRSLSHLAVVWIRSTHWRRDSGERPDAQQCVKQLTASVFQALVCVCARVCVWVSGHKEKVLLWHMFEQLREGEVGAISLEILSEPGCASLFHQASTRTPKAQSFLPVL